MDKLFAVAGTSVLEGVAKVRFAKDMSRVKVLEKNGHKDVKLVELPQAMGKDAAVAYLMSHASFKDAASQAVLKGHASDEKPAKASKMAEAVVHAAAKTVKAKKAAAEAKPAKAEEDLEAIRAKNLETIKKVHRKLKAEKAKEDERAAEETAELEEELELAFEVPGLSKRPQIEDFDA